MLSDQERQELERLIDEGETRRAACVDAMSWVQSRHGWVSDEHLAELAELLAMSTEELDAVATFYNLVFRRRVGRHVILVCDSISCWICGSNTVMDHLCRSLAVEPGQTSADGEFTVLPVPCLGFCHRAPTMMVDDKIYPNLTGEKIDRILAEVRASGKAGGDG